MVTTRIYTEPPICKKEILRYAGCKDTVEESLQFLLEECLQEVLPKLSYKVCFEELVVDIKEDVCNFESLQIVSKDLARNLRDCERTILFAATIGTEIDRLIRRYGAISPAKAVMLQAIGAERIESLCDMFCEELGANNPRFSPGYGDLPLETQRLICARLDCSKHIGVGLNESLLMSPSKSVTAFAGIKSQTEGAQKHDCKACSKTDCMYRE